MRNKIIKEIMSYQNPKKAKILARFFKTSKGEYGEGDLFLGITVPEARKIAIKYEDIPLSDVDKLIKNKYHEVRLTALLILVQKYKISQLSARKVLAEKEQKEIFNFYLKHTKYINNWDLVDLSAYQIIGNYLSDKGKKILIKLAKSKNIWERRIAIVSTFAFIKNRENYWTFRIVKILIKDDHDLIHKACGWMLREVGKRVSENDLILFMDKHQIQMPRIMFRYAIERLPNQKRFHYLKSSKINYS